MGEPIRMLPHRFDVGQAQEQLNNPGVWNLHDERRKSYVHAGVDDIWLRYGRDVQDMEAPHVSEWYPVVHEIPALWGLVRRVCRAVRATELGGVLITRIPPGGRVEPHVDRGWHAGYYEKIAVQIKGDDEQAFHFEDASLSASDGETYTFDNSRLHWVTNDSDRERITMIVCLRRKKMTLPANEMIPFDMYFASLASMQVHPGAGSKEHKPMSLEACRDMALQMIAIRRQVEEN